MIDNNKIFIIPAVMIDIRFSSVPIIVVEEINLLFVSNKNTMLSNRNIKKKRKNEKTKKRKNEKKKGNRKKKKKKKRPTND
jgi:hypothetical protein